MEWTFRYVWYWMVFNSAEIDTNCFQWFVMALFGELNTNLLINRLSMGHGSRLKAHGSRLKSRGSKIMAHGQECFWRVGPGPDEPRAKCFLGHEP